MYFMEKFAERMNEYMITRELNATQLADKTGIARPTISGLLRKEHLPSTEALRAFSDFFQCPADYLLGLIDDFPEKITFQKSILSFGERFRMLLTENKVSQYALTKQHKISGNLIYKWLHNESEPSVYNLIKLSKALSVSIDCLLGRE